MSTARDYAWSLRLVVDAKRFKPVPDSDSRTLQGVFSADKVATAAVILFLFSQYIRYDDVL